MMPSPYCAGYIYDLPQRAQNALPEPFISIRMDAESMKISGTSMPAPLISLP